MQNVFKQFGGKVTDSFHKRFESSIVNLTVFYAITLTVILVISGAVTHSVFSRRVDHRFAAFPASGHSVVVIVQPPTGAQVREDLFESMILTNGFLLFLAIVLSYWLARKTLEPIKESYNRQKQFLDDASHELRTPLAILKLDIENQLRAADPSLRQKLESNLEEVNRMSVLVDDVLRLSRLEESQQRDIITLASLPVHSVVSKSIERLQPLAMRHGVALHSTIVDSLTVRADEDIVLHSLSNVIQNAIIYNKKDGTVTLTAHEEGKNVCIVVSDTGVGIATESLTHIFDRFYRADNSRSRASGGSGLGLSIVKTGIERMGGTLSIASELGKGTVVTLCLPRA